MRTALDLEVIRGVETRTALCLPDGGRSSQLGEVDERIRHRLRPAHEMCGHVLHRPGLALGRALPFLGIEAAEERGQRRGLILADLVPTAVRGLGDVTD